MPSVHERLYNYYGSIAKIMRGQADAASVFPNTTDNGITREGVYIKFLKQLLPSICNIFPGGFLFDAIGNESNQMDIIVTTNTCPRFDFSTQNEGGKSFSHIEGTLAVISIKSMLNKDGFHEALSGLQTVPQMASLTGRTTLGLSIKRYEEWPLKVIIAYDGTEIDTTIKNLNDFINFNPHQNNRLPDIIHVFGKYALVRITPETGNERGVAPVSEIGKYMKLTIDPDVQAMLAVLTDIQERAQASVHILYEYLDIINSIADFLKKRNGL